MAARRASKESVYRENLIDALWRYAHQIEVAKPGSKHASRRERNNQHYTLIDELLWLADYFPYPKEDMTDAAIEREVADLLARCRSDQMRTMPLSDYVQLIRRASLN